MNSNYLIISFIFFLAALISIFWGIYVIVLNPKKKTNRAFLFVCISLSIWNLGFGMTNISQNLSDALFWRRFAALGWTSLYSVTLHFLILLTRKNKDIKIKNYIYLLYIPAIICIYAFSLSPDIASIQNDLVKTNFGWTNLADNTGWNYFYYAYYSLYMLASVSLVWKWRKRIKEKNKARKSNLVIVSIIISLAMASLIDIVLTSFGFQQLPQIAPLFIMLPTWAMYYSSRYYNLINDEKIENKEIIVSEEDKKKIFRNIAVVFFAGSIFNLIFEYTKFANDNSYNIKLGIINSIMFFLTGIIIYFLQSIKKDSLRENLTIAVLVANIPIITLLFFEYSSVTIWVFPVLLIIVSLVFSKKRLLIWSTIAAVASQVLIWILKADQQISINRYDYIFRILIFLTAYIAGSYVNNIYVKKIRENEYQMDFKKIHSKVSSDFVTINKENADQKIDNLLEELGLFLDVDRTCLILIDSEKNTMRASHEWCNRGVKGKTKYKKEIPLSNFHWWIRELKEKKLVYINDISDIPLEAIAEREEFIKHDFKSSVSVSIETIDGIQGFIGIDAVKSEKSWEKEDMEILKILSNLLADALIKIKSENEIEFMAYYDHLTGLPNRFLFEKEVNKAIELAEKEDKAVSIVFVDLDNFKSVNDTMGHKGGDSLLGEVAKELVAKLRDRDIVARFGGDEFMIMVDSLDDRDNIIKVADKIMSIFSKPFNIEGQEFFVKASAGIATFPIDGEDSETLIKNADNAMYAAKYKGKNGYSLCTSEMKDEVQKNMRLSNDLHYAIERDELVLYYQPQVNLSNKEITGLEALIRWKHPEFGMVSPGVFIPLAEKNGLIHIIGEWVIKTACRQNKKLQDMGLAYIDMAVNLSSVQFTDDQIVEKIKRALIETELDPKYLELEITESIAINETGSLVETLEKLQELGVSIAIDDFGTEYSSLSRLKNLPIDRIKVDMEFIRGIGENQKDEAITVIIINLAKSLGLNVLAEGVETSPQLDFLNKKMCDYVQGYYYYRPMPADDLEELLEKKKKMPISI